MRKFIFFLAIFSMAGTFLTGCTGRNMEREREDSIRQADSIKAALQAEEEAKAAAEQARLDSLRQDSILPIERAIAVIPTFKEIQNSQDLVSFFKKRGFTISKKTAYVDKYEDNFTFITAIYNPGNGIYCKFVEDLYGYDYTITGAPELYNLSISSFISKCILYRI